MINLHEVVECLETGTLEEIRYLTNNILEEWSALPMNVREVICIEICNKYRKYINSIHFEESLYKYHLSLPSAIEFITDSNYSSYHEYQTAVPDKILKFECWERILRRFKEPLLVKPDSETWEEYIGKLSKEDKVNFLLFIYSAEVRKLGISIVFLYKLFESFDYCLKKFIVRNSVMYW